MVDDVRRRRCAPVVTWVEEGDARLLIMGGEKKSWRPAWIECDVASSIAYANFEGWVAERVGAKP